MPNPRLRANGARTGSSAVAGSWAKARAPGLRLQAAAANRLDYEELLEIILQDEPNVRKQRLLSRRTKAADFTFERLQAASGM